MSILTSLTWHSVHRTHEGKELPWDYPVQVAVLDFLIMLVFLHIEGVIVVPALLDAELKTFNAVLHSALIEALTFACIAVSPQKASVGCELLHGFSSTFAQDHDHEGRDQESAIRHLDTVVVRTCVVVDASIALILARLEQFLQLATVSVHVGQVERSKI